MHAIHIQGAHPLHGDILISGAKNAALPIMAACLMSDKTLALSNVPNLADIHSMLLLLGDLGVDITENLVNNTLVLHAQNIQKTEASYDIVRKMRASIVVLGPLLARMGQAQVSLPGGCAIGTRPVDIHIQGLEAMGADILIEKGFINASAPRGLKGCVYTLPFPSVGATQNLLMAACYAQGDSVLKNVAREPEIENLIDALKAMGFLIEGAGTDTLCVKGNPYPSLHDAVHAILPDRIETGTYAVAALITNGCLTLHGTSLDLIPAFADKLVQAGAHVVQKENGFSIQRGEGVIRGVDVMTEPYPGFPTDLQAQMMALMSICHGASMVSETIFENRFMHVPELCRMGANITVHGRSALIRGQKHLTGAPVMATDLRASVSLVLAGLAAQGETIVNRIYHLDRGYEKLEEKLQNCGAHIERRKAL
jgi:UDP-N-acetylglucosamine 1-carboxyvinyltransferase